MSNGLMYAPTTMRGEAIDERYALRRQLNEPLTEMIQTKGASETHPLLSPSDEFASFEMFPNMINTSTPSKVRNGYVRQALTDGLLLEEKLGTNPFKFGIVSGADIHYGTHLVYVHDHQKAQPRVFADVKEQVRQLWESDKREQLNEQFVASTLARYDMTIEDVATKKLDN